MKLSFTTSFVVITAAAQKPLTASHDNGQRSSVGKIIGGLSVPQGKVGLLLMVTATNSPSPFFQFPGQYPFMGVPGMFAASDRRILKAQLATQLPSLSCKRSLQLRVQPNSLRHPTFSWPLHWIVSRKQHLLWWRQSIRIRRSGYSPCSCGTQAPSLQCC